MKILLIEDDQSIASILKKVLTAYNYQIEIVNDGQTGLEFVKAFDYDLLLLDVMLPKLDGISLCQQLRLEGYQMPILMLTANNSTTTRVMSLDVGADDYVIKPFETSELIARIRALLRRGREVLPTLLTWENLHLNSNTREVTYGDKFLHLTPKEYSLLELFLRNPCRIFSRSALLDRIWLSSEIPGEEAVTTQIKGLRRKLKAVGITADLIETVYGFGYRLNKKDKAKEEQGKAKQAEAQTEKHIAEAKVMAVVTTMWDEYKESLKEKFDLFEQVQAHLSKKTLDIQLLKEAQAEAHRLAGSLGCYGLLEGSKVARQIELWLQSLISLKQSATFRMENLEKSIKYLKKILQQQVFEEEDKIVSRQRGADGEILYSSLLSPLSQEKCHAKARNRAMVTRIREELKQIHLANQIELFEQALVNLSTTSIDRCLLSEAEAVAHYLVGSLECLELPEGSKVAREIELSLQVLTSGRQSITLQWEKFEELIKLLKKILKQSTIPVTPSPSIPSARLLIIDDDIVVRERIKVEAIAWDLEVEEATSLIAARRLVAVHPPDVILLDLSLLNSQQKSITFIRELTEDKPGIPVIVFSSSNQLDQRVEAARLGAYCFLHKTMSVVQVLSVVKTALNHNATKAKVMVVDDDPIILNHVKTLLLPRGFQITTLQYPHHFWKVLEAVIPDLLVLDIKMPGFSGIELCQAVRNDTRWNQLPVIFLSVCSDTETLHEVYAVGADDYVEKPIVESELITRILNRLERTQKNLKNAVSYRDPHYKKHDTAKLCGQKTNF
ncbi:MAG: response regulator [Rhizonema sp. PD38]|nr:response regulator [Rhizonema sp. PD38]